jgi:hypothetical protein
VLIIYGSRQPLDLVRGFADYLLQRLKGSLIRAVRVGDEIGAAPDRAGQKRLAAYKGSTDRRFKEPP